VVSGDHLDSYRAKRHFDVTAEPSGAGDGGGASGSGPRFVIQEHAARRHHYDVRFEVEGVMASWAVPKGPSLDPSVKRLAVHVEDHPLDYRTFEGTIPGGEYGAGSVIVWDEGTYRNDSTERGRPIDVRRAIAKGHLSVWLDGQKLQGGWSLIRTAGDRDNWLMIKRGDDHARTEAPSAAEDLPAASVRSGRRINEIAGDPSAGRWTRGTATWMPPMLAVLAPRRPRTGQGAPPVPAGEWVLERKLDGLRGIAVRNGASVELWSRNHQSYTARFPAVVRALASLAADNFVIDGELAAFDADGRTSFSLLQRRESAVLCAFDLLHLLGRSTVDLGVAERRHLLARLVTPGPALRVVETVGGDPAEALARACAQGWEGLIAKRAGSPYRSGRSADWLKLKCSASQELVVGGWTDPKGSRQGFGALLVGYYDDGGALRYAGKVGTGFDTATLADLYARLEARRRPCSPFADDVKERGAHWVEPYLVAQVAFTEWTSHGRLRHPRFEGLRSDKAAGDVVREQQ
jgi:bifunctional non-homologous end joining protein LigD